MKLRRTHMNERTLIWHPLPVTRVYVYTPEDLDRIYGTTFACYAGGTWDEAQGAWVGGWWQYPEWVPPRPSPEDERRLRHAHALVSALGGNGLRVTLHGPDGEKLWVVDQNGEMREVTYTMFADGLTEPTTQPDDPT
jgi:hypothetical protein